MENEQTGQALYYQTTEMRMQCLHLAAKSERPDLQPADIISTAQQFYDFVRGGDLKPAPALKVA